MRFFIALADRFAQALYAVAKGIVPSRRKIVLLSRQSDVPSRDFALLAEELRSRDRSLEIVSRCRMIGGSLWKRAASVPEMVVQMYHLAGARVCVVDGYVIPVSLLKHRAGTLVVQMWHALGAVKKFGYQTIDRRGA
jgi:CDP-ribitol ribitolphosphotransferase